MTSRPGEPATPRAGGGEDRRCRCARSRSGTIVTTDPRCPDHGELTGRWLDENFRDEP